MILGLSESVGLRKLKGEEDNRKGEPLANNQEAYKKIKSTAQVDESLLIKLKFIKETITVCI